MSTSLAASTPPPAQEPAGDASQRSTIEDQIEKRLPVESRQGDRRQKIGRVIVIGAAAQPRFTGEPISLSLKNADLQEVLRSFARIADVNLVLDPKVEGSVTVELDDVPWDQALWVILKSQGLGAELNGRLWRVQP